MAKVDSVMSAKKLVWLWLKRPDKFRHLW